MAKFVNNKPKFKVGDKVVYSGRQDHMAKWEKESISNGPLTIERVNRVYENEELVHVNYYVKGLEYVYSEDWLSYAPAGPKFKIGDLVYINNFTAARAIDDVITKIYASDGHQEYQYLFRTGPSYVTFYEINLKPASSEETLIHDLEICGGENGCAGCSREEPDNCGLARGCCDKINLDAAELIKKLQKRVKELEEEKK